MKFPFKIASQEKMRGLEIWNKQFIATDRHIHEGIWRRTQAKENKIQSKWKFTEDRRWRVVHFIDNYGVVCTGKTANLVLKGVYLKINHSLPTLEADKLFKRMADFLKAKNTIYKNTKRGLSTSIGDLKIKINIFNSKSDKTKKYLLIPSNYKMVDVEITGGSMNVGNKRRYYPWKVIKKGFRIPLQKGHPKYVKTTEEILKYKPFQIELGCGPSTEVGIYPLSYLHKIYQTTNNGKTYVFGDDDQLFETIVKSPTNFYFKATKIMVQSWLAKTNSDFYKWIKKAYDKGYVVGPVITNNYDGIVSRLDIPELYVRKFTDQFLIPKIKFNKNAKSLLVIGCHADRRLVQQSARKQGLKVIFVDPEQYVDANGKVFKYKIEAPQDNDIIFKAKASDFAKTFNTKPN